MLSPRSSKREWHTETAPPNIGLFFVRVHLSSMNREMVDVSFHVYLWAQPYLPSTTTSLCEYHHKSPGRKKWGRLLFTLQVTNRNIYIYICNLYIYIYIQMIYMYILYIYIYIYYIYPTIENKKGHHFPKVPFDRLCWCLTSKTHWEVSCRELVLYCDSLGANIQAIWRYLYQRPYTLFMTVPRHELSLWRNWAVLIRAGCVQGLYHPNKFFLSTLSCSTHACQLRSQEQNQVQ